MGSDVAILSCRTISPQTSSSAYAYSRRQIQAVSYTGGIPSTSGIRLLYRVADGKPLHDDGFVGEAKQVFEKVKKDFDW